MKIPEPQKTPSGWRIQLRLGGQSFPITAEDRQTCIRQAQLVKAEYMADRSIRTSSNKTVRQAIDRYIDDRSAVLSPSTIRGYTQIRDNRFVSIMDTPIRSVKNWQAVVNTESRLRSAKTVRNAWGLIVSVLQNEGLHVPSVNLPQVARKELPWLDLEQIRVFLSAIEGHPAEIVMLCCLNGLRISEVYALEKSSFDLKRREIRVSGARVQSLDGFTQKDTNKTAASARNVPIMFDRLLLLAEDLPAAGPITDYNQRHMHDTINRVCRAHGLPLVGCHGLRRSFASLCAHGGTDGKPVPESICMLWGGWSDAHTMRTIYQKIYDSDKAKYADQIRGHFNP